MPDPAFLPARYERVECTSATLVPVIEKLGRRAVLRQRKSDHVRAYEVSEQLQNLGLGLLLGRAVDLGCGSGRDARWLSQNGWDVVGVDRHPELASHFVDLSTKFVCSDIRNFRDSDGFDLAVLHFTWFDGILKIVESVLKPNGVCSLLVHSPLHYRCFGSPKVEVVIPTGFTIEKTSEFWMNDRHVSGYVLRRSLD